MPCPIKPDMHHTCLCIMPCVCGGCLPCCFASFRVASLVSFGFVPELWGFVRLRPLVFFMDSFFFLAGSQARWPYPRNHFYLCLLVVRSIAMLRYLPLAGNEIERGMGIPTIESQASNIPMDKGNCIRDWLNPWHRGTCGSQHGYPNPSVGYWPERCLGHVCMVLEPVGSTHLRFNDARVIWE